MEISMFPEQVEGFLFLTSHTDEKRYISYFSNLLSATTLTKTG